jgi:hypothetical protein
MNAELARTGKGHLYQHASSGPRAGGDAGAVGISDGLDDRKAEGALLVQARLPAGQREQCLDELFLLGAGREHPLMRCAEGVGGGAGVGQGDLADDPLTGQGRAQLV